MNSRSERPPYFDATEPREIPVKFEVEDLDWLAMKRQPFTPNEHAAVLRIKDLTPRFKLRNYIGPIRAIRIRVREYGVQFQVDFRPKCMQRNETIDLIFGGSTIPFHTLTAVSDVEDLFGHALYSTLHEVTTHELRENFEKDGKPLKEPGGHG